MKQLFVLIAVIFGLASMTSPGMAAAITSGHFLSVTSDANGWCEAERAHDRVMTVKHCAKKINGQAVLCHQAVAVLPAGIVCPVAAQAQSFALVLTRVEIGHVQSGWFRPPRIAG
jgi:hypothetical protein